MRKWTCFLLIVLLIILITPFNLTSLQLPTTNAEPVVDIPPPPEVLPRERHIVRSGESLWSLANKYSTTIQAIKTCNNMYNDTIITGETIIIPQRTYYITRQNLYKNLIGIDKLLEAIYIAEGSERSRVPYGATSFYDSGKKFSHRRSQYFFDILSKDHKANSREYYKMASAVTVLYYWELYQGKNKSACGKLLNEVASNTQIDFIHYLGAHYAPISASPLNKSWIKNVLYHFDKG